MPKIAPGDFKTSKIFRGETHEPPGPQDVKNQEEMFFGGGGIGPPFHPLISLRFPKIYIVLSNNSKSIKKSGKVRENRYEISGKVRENRSKVSGKVREIRKMVREKSGKLNFPKHWEPCKNNN